ncbi:glycoside hydrolase family 88 protein, partial [Deinococcus pimensis]|uniref:glycoside hydrolase family 88 protein n=1 Tax=Deinococcus pimensis TaxID=309888 RepID=UPI0005EACBAD
WLRDAVSRAVTGVRVNVRVLGTRFPDDTTHADVYPPRPPAFGEAEGGNVGWTTGFWTGQLWLAYELTGQEAFRTAALAHVDSFEDRARRRVDTDHHGLGFLYTLSCVPAWRLTRDAR